MKNLSHTAPPRIAFQVHNIEHLSPTAFIVYFDRNDMTFSPGQYITVGIAGEMHVREYSIYSRPDDDYLAILVKRVDDGLVTPRLAKLQPGDALQVEGPFGYFVLDEIPASARIFMIATGTGISPFHSMIQSRTDRAYTLLHGVRTEQEDYAWNSYPSDRLVRCISQPQAVHSGDFTGRVTEYLRQHPVTDPSVYCFLCGNCDMIYEAFDILQSQGVPTNQLFAEVYF